LRSGHAEQVRKGARAVIDGMPPEGQVPSVLTPPAPPVPSRMYEPPPTNGKQAMWAGIATIVIGLIGGAGTITVGQSQDSDRQQVGRLMVLEAADKRRAQDMSEVKDLLADVVREVGGLRMEVKHLVKEMGDLEQELKDTHRRRR